MSKVYDSVSKEDETQSSARSSLASDNDELLRPEAESKRYEFSDKKNIKNYLPLAIPYSIILVLSIAVGVLTFRKPHDISLGTTLFTPAKDAVEYYEHTFTWNFWDKGEYMGFPTDEIDKKWSDLYNFGTSGIPNEQAKLLHDETVPVPDSDSKSLIMLDMWHQLHCLNAIRMAMYPERWPEIWEKHPNGSINYDTVEMKHVDHCIDHIRQSLMCFADVSPTSFFFDPKRGNNPKPVGTHMCRNYNKIKDWAIDRRVLHYSNQDKILGPGHELGFDDKHPELGHSEGGEPHHHHHID